MVRLNSDKNTTTKPFRTSVYCACADFSIGGAKKHEQSIMSQLRLTEREAETDCNVSLRRHRSRHRRNRGGKGRNRWCSHRKRHHAGRRNCHRRSGRNCGRLLYRRLERCGCRPCHRPKDRAVISLQRLRL